MRSRSAILLAGSALGAMLVAAMMWIGPTTALGQSGSRVQSGSSTQSGTRGAAGSFEARFWNFLQTAKYQHWAPAPGQGDQLYPGQSPHGAQLAMYLNRRAVTNPTELPGGSIIVKENYADDGQTLMAVTVMYRSEGYDPEHNDWYWVKYNPDGSVAQNDGMLLAGRVGGCIDCHSSSTGEDFAFFND